MFPPLRVKLSGLDPLKHYCVVLDIFPASNRRYKFCNGHWMVVGGADQERLPQMYVHPDSPALGNDWMKEGTVNFHKVKLTNSIRDCSENVRSE